MAITSEAMRRYGLRWRLRIIISASTIPASSRFFGAPKVWSAIAA